MYTRLRFTHQRGVDKHRSRLRLTQQSGVAVEYLAREMRRYNRVCLWLLKFWDTLGRPSGSRRRWVQAASV